MSEQQWWVINEEAYPKGDNPMGNRFYGYRRTDLLLPSGETATYHGVDVRPCVHMVAIEEDLTTYLVRQSRPNLLRAGETRVPTTLELPGGFATDDLSLADSARKELKEEIKLDATDVEQIGTINPSPGISNEYDHIFLGRGLMAAGAFSGEATERDMRIVAEPFGKLYDQMLKSELPVPAQTLAAMAMAAARL